jgi:hypothetical protein
MSDLIKLITALKRHYGAPVTPPAKGPFELVVWENACYLLPDERRAEVFEGLRQQVGLTPAAILGAERSTLLKHQLHRGIGRNAQPFGRFLEFCQERQRHLSFERGQVLPLPVIGRCCGRKYG